jgi:hypothetical protein
VWQRVTYPVQDAGVAALGLKTAHMMPIGVRADHLFVNELFAKLNSKLRGYYNYYGIRGNYDNLQNFFHHATRILFKMLNRRSQRRSYNWKGFAELIKAFKLCKPRICHSF